MILFVYSKQNKSSKSDETSTSMISEVERLALSHLSPRSVLSFRVTHVVRVRQVTSSQKSLRPRHGTFHVTKMSSRGLFYASETRSMQWFYRRYYFVFKLSVNDMRTRQRRCRFGFASCKREVKQFEKIVAARQANHCSSPENDEKAFQLQREVEQPSPSPLCSPKTTTPTFRAIAAA